MAERSCGHWHRPARITAENGPRLARLGALMIDAFCTRAADENEEGR